MTFPAKFSCGYYHYTFQQWSKVHGESKPFVDPYVQMPFVNGELWDKNEYNPENPYPLITYKWVCQFCGETGNSHTPNCEYYLEKMDIEAGISTTTSTSASSTHTKPPETKPDETEVKKTLGEWSKGKDRKITAYQFKKLFSIVDQKKKYTLTELLALLPKEEPKKPTPIPTPDGSRPPTPEPTDPLLKAIKDIEIELGGFGGLFSKYIEFSPYFSPETEINELGNEKNVWKEETWLEFIRDATSLDDLQGKENNNNRKLLVLLVFGNVMLLHYLERRDLKAIDKFVADLQTNYQINLIEYTTFNELFEQIKQLREEPKESVGNWDDVLDKIYNKFNGWWNRPKSLKQAKEFVEKELKTLPKSGIDGDIRDVQAKKEDLLNLKKGSSNMSLSGGKGEIKDFSTWTALDSNRDGNCFLNSFSLLMKGDQFLSTELRARMCLYLLQNAN